MYITNLIIIAVISYFLGSIPFGYILVRIFTGSDVRSQGSGNIGATNVARTGRKGLAIATLFLDALKGYVAVLIAKGGLTYRWLISQPDAVGSDIYWHRLYTFAAVAAVFAILGHMFPVWLHFRGGKGVATGLGVFLAFAPRPVAAVMIVFFIVVALTRYVSLGSIVSSALFPIAFWYMDRKHASPIVLMIVTLVPLLIIWKHRENIARLIAGTENKFGSKKGKETS